MAIDTSIPRTRRALLAGGLGGLAAIVASALGRPLPAEAASGVFDSSTLATPAVRATHRAGGEGVYGWTSSGDGIHGSSSSGVGVHGSSSTGVGVEGWSAYGDGVVGGSGGSTKSGVYGYSTVDDGYGVFGRSKVTGSTGYLGGLSGVVGRAIGYPAVSGIGTNNPGVYGSCDAWPGVLGESKSGDGVYGVATSGVGLHGVATTGYALRTSGRLRVDKASGVATIGAGKSSTSVKPGLGLTGSSFVLLTPRGNLGGRDLWYTVDATTDVFTIRVSKPVGANFGVGWLLLG